MFTEGQKVWCAIYGAGVVVEIHQEGGVKCPVEVRFNNERTCVYISDGRYYDDSNIVLFPYPIEITKAVTKPSIDWSHVGEYFRYLAMDSGGNGYLCGKNPHYDNTIWLMEAPYIPATAFTSYVPGTCDWKDSLVERPV